MTDLAFSVSNHSFAQHIEALLTRAGAGRSAQAEKPAVA